jgi:acetyl-CoA carboxylase biotin carboxylase subunit
MRRRWRRRFLSFDKILIANRGEIALRVIRACRELGIQTVLVYSEADAHSLPVHLADEAICVGPASARESYLNIPSIMSAALISGAQAIHPGYGFLAENADFAEVCKEHGLVFIGPPPEILRRFHDKVATRVAMKKLGLPVIPGSDGPVKTMAEALRIAEAVGYPVMLKARSGGGGRGMRKVTSPQELQRLWDQASTEAKASFGDPGLYVERCLEGVRHVEAQIAVDEYGSGICLGERECSIQRRNQKMIEEAPSASISEDLRQAIARRAVDAAVRFGYRNVGTFEFLVDARGEFYFIEVNSRIQVEHTVTEMTTGIDLVKEQIALASGQPLSFSEEQIWVSGHAIECRINAEDSEQNFAPSTGVLTTWLQPGGPGIRIDTHCFQGYEVPPYYDSLLAKVIAWGRDRAEAVTRMQRALDEFTIVGVTTNIPAHKKILASDLFRSGQVTTHLIDTVGVDALTA